jgi:hypothetical protein
MPVVINEFEAVAAPAVPAPSTAPVAVRPRLTDSQRVLRQLAARAARLRAH